MDDWTWVEGIESQEQQRAFKNLSQALNREYDECDKVFRSLYSYTDRVTSEEARLRLAEYFYQKGDKKVGDIIKHRTRMM